MDKHVSTGEPLFASVSISTSGDNAVIAGVAGKQIRVIAGVLVAAGSVTLTAYSDVGGSEVALSGAMSMIAGTPFVLTESDCGYFQTAAGKALNFKLGGAVQVSGCLTYEVF